MHRHFQRYSHQRVAPYEAKQPSSWSLRLDIQAPTEDKPHLSLNEFIYVYTPWHYFSIKYQLWKLKLLWDLQFEEQKFLENSKKAAIIITNTIREQNSVSIRRCTTPMGYRQIHHDLFGTGEDWRMKAIRFQLNHIKRVVPLKVHMLHHYDHKFAFIDVMYVGVRRINDFPTLLERREMERYLETLNYSNIPKPHGPGHQYPAVYAEIFIRFRRDYAKKSNTHLHPPPPSHWLVSAYRLLFFDVINFDPEAQKSMAYSYGE